MKITLFHLYLFLFFFPVKTFSQGNPNLYSPPKVHTFSQACINSDYQVVYLEDFESNVLKPEEWITYFPVDDPYKRTHFDGSHHIFLDENVWVTNGILHLKTKEGPYTYHWVDENGIDQQITRPYTAALVQSNNNTPASDHNSGCWKYGKFSIRAKIPSQSGATAAFWFFGWPGEIDVFEFFDGPQGLLSTNIHLWHLANNGSHPDDVQRHNLGDLSSAFHTYTFEWTPFKWEWSVDGIPIRTIYRYLQFDLINTTPIDCSNVPLEKPVLLIEHLAWDLYDDFNVDMLLTTGVHEDFKTPGSFIDSEMLIDYIKIEQKNEFNWEINEVSPLCDSQSTNYSILCNDNFALEDYSFLDWSVSPNLQITGYNNNNSGVDLALLASPSDTGWIQVDHLKNENGCLDISLRKTIQIGSPIQGEYSTHCKNQDFLPKPLLPSNLGPGSKYSISLHCAGFSSYTWETNSTINFASHSNGSELTFELKEYQLVHFTVTAYGECGSTKREFSFQAGKKCEAIIIDDGLHKFSGFSFFPNPSSETIYITNEEVQTYHLKLYNQAGSLIQSKKCIQQKQISLDLSDLPVGIYLVNIILEGEVFSKQIIKE